VEVGEPPYEKQAGRLEPKPYTLPIQFVVWVVYYCDETGVPVWIAARMFDRESEWYTRAVSWAGAQGLAQIMPANLEESALLYNDGDAIDPFDPETAIRVGIRHLSALYSLVGSWKGAIAAYNCGIGRYLSGRRLPAETVEYVRIVMKEE
jgi:soluble lytic murein transglycosylase-like protein